MAHNSYDEFWKKHAVAYGLKEATVPNLNVAGWWDQEDFYGPMFTYENLEKTDRKNLNYLVVGPVESRRLGTRHRGIRSGRYRSAATPAFISASRWKRRGLPTG